MDLVSVIIPVYKVEEYLDKCVESAVNQTYKNLEIILVDDGSPDNCPKMCDDWAKKDKRIKVIHKENGGLSDARNFGIEKATGEFYIFLDSDDKMDLEEIEILYSTLKKHDADVVMSDIIFVSDLNETPKLNKESYSEEVVEGEDIFRLIFNKQYPMIMSAWAKIYKKEVFKDIRYPKGKIHEDEFVIHRILDKIKKFVYISAQLNINLHRSNSICSSKFNKKRFHAIESRIERVEFCEKKGKEYYQLAINQLLKTTILYYTMARKSGMKKEDLIFLLETFNKYYKISKKKDLVIKMFKYFRNITYMIMKSYVKKKKLIR